MTQKKLYGELCRDHPELLEKESHYSCSYILDSMYKDIVQIGGRERMSEIAYM